MNTFLISFEIFPPSFAVQEEILINAIKSFDSWARLTSKVWLIKTYSAREQVMDHLRANAGPNDRIIVMLANNDWVALNLPNDVINWMKLGL